MIGFRKKLSHVNNLILICIGNFGIVMDLHSQFGTERVTIQEVQF